MRCLLDLRKIKRIKATALTGRREEKHSMKITKVFTVEEVV